MNRKWAADEYRPKNRQSPRIFDEFPALSQAVPWTAVAHLPTPVESAERLGAILGTDRVWIKRDDLASPLYGGNKVRRFEYILADAWQKGATSLVTVGGLASTQVTATILFGKAAGFEVEVVMFDQPATAFMREALSMDVAAGGRLRFGGGYAATALKTLMLLRRVDRPYFIFPGASNPMFNLGYIDAMYELSDQVARGEIPIPDRIVLPCGSGGTVAALSIGAALLGWPTIIEGVRITDRIACNRVTISGLIEATWRYLCKRAGRNVVQRKPTRFTLEHRLCGRGYGFPTMPSVEASQWVELFAGNRGEVTYSGKGLAGLREICRRHPTENILYWHTLSSCAPRGRADVDDLPNGIREAALRPTVA